VSLKDEFGNEYRQITYGPGSRVLFNNGGTLAADDASIRPGFLIVDCLVFDLPVGAAKTLTLRLPLANVGEEGFVTLNVPTGKGKT
jgi:hypothetical protein